MSALIIGDAQRQQIAKLRALAADNVMDPAAMVNVAQKDMAAYRQMMRTLSLEIPHGYIVTYSHERQPFGLARHISISVGRPHKMPHPAAVDMILDAFALHRAARNTGGSIDGDERQRTVLLVLRRQPWIR